MNRIKFMRMAAPPPPHMAPDLGACTFDPDSLHDVETAVATYVSARAAGNALTPAVEKQKVVPRSTHTPKRKARPPKVHLVTKAAPIPELAPPPPRDVLVSRILQTTDAAGAFVHPDLVDALVAVADTNTLLALRGANKALKVAVGRRVGRWVKLQMDKLRAVKPDRLKVIGTGVPRYIGNRDALELLVNPFLTRIVREAIQCRCFTRHVEHRVQHAIWYTHRLEEILSVGTVLSPTEHARLVCNWQKLLARKLCVGGDDHVEVTPGLVEGLVRE